MEVSRLRSGRLSKQKKNYPFNAAWTSECSWRATVAPAGWTSSGLRATHDYISRFVHVILAPVHVFFSVSFKRETPRIMFIILTQGALLSSARADVEIFLRRHCRRRGKNWQELRPMCRRDSSPEYSTRIPYVSPIPSYITARQRFPKSCNSLLETAHKKKTTCHLRGHDAEKKKTQYVLFLYMPKRRPNSRSCHRVLISVSFKSDEHQYSSSKASATDEPNATLRRVSSLQMTPIHSHSSRSSSSRHSRKEVCAWIWRTGTQHCPSPANSTKASKTMSSSGVYGASDSLSSLSDASCPGSTLASELSLEAASSVCVVS